MVGAFLIGSGLFLAPVTHSGKNRVATNLESYGTTDTNGNGLIGDTVTGRTNNYKTTVGTVSDLLANQANSETSKPLTFTRGTTSPTEQIPYRLDGFLATFLSASDPKIINAYFPWAGTYQFGTVDGVIRNLKHTQNTFAITPFYDYTGDEVSKNLCRNYAGVMSVYPQSDGSLDMFVHCEYHPDAPDWKRAYWSVSLYRYVWDAALGKAVYKQITPILTSYDDFDPNINQQYGLGIPSAIKIGDYYYVYFNDYHYDPNPSQYLAGESNANVAVARALISEAGNPAAWKKMYRGAFTESGNVANPFAIDGTGKAGMASGIFHMYYGGDTNSLFSSSHASVSYNSYTKNYMAVINGHKATWNAATGSFDQSNKGVYMSFSNDGIYWAEPKLIVTLTDDEDYPTAINDTNGDSQTTGQQFKLVYSKQGVAKYRVVKLARISAKEVQCNGIDDNGNGTIDENVCS